MLSYKSSATVVPFPQRAPTLRRQEREASRVEVLREALGGWFVIHTARGHAWLHGSRREALADAHELADDMGCGIVVHIS